MNTESQESSEVHTLVIQDTNESPLNSSTAVHYEVS